jgi:rod shape-determining protein MreC
MLKRPHYMALCLVGLLTLIVLTLPHETANRLKLAIGGLFLPLYGLSKSTQQISRQAGTAVTSKAELARQNEALRQTNQVLQLRAMQAEALARENEQLHQLLGWRQKSPQSLWDLRLAHVVSHDPANWWQAIRIDLGSRDGMRQDMTVLTPAGLVGRISSVSLTSCQVALIGSPSCRVAATFGRNAEDGVITGGAGPLDNTMVTLMLFSGSSDLKPGLQVITSGKGGIFPKGIVIGQISEDSRQVELGYAEVRVKLAVDLNSLDHVFVKMP